MDLSKLRKRVPFHWKPNNKVGTGNYTKFQCVGYLDARQVRDILDEVVGPTNWKCDYKDVKGNLFGGIGINVNGDKMCGEYPAPPEWLWRWDCGTESNVDKQKGETSDAFKRASVTWGIGAFLYDLGIIKVPAKEHTNKKWYPCDDKGNIFWNNNDLEKYINKKYPKLQPKDNPPSIDAKKEPPKPEPKKDDRYNKDKTGVYSTNKHNFTPETVTAVGKLNRDGKTGGAVLCLYLKEYNKKYDTSFTKVGDITSDAEIMKFVKYVKSLPPKDL